MLIHDVISDNRLDVLVMTERWIPLDAPDAIKLNVAPPGYVVVHRHRGSSTDRRGGGLALIHRNTSKASSVSVGDYTEFESLAVKLVGRRSASVIVVCVYRPPGTVLSAFIDQLSDLLDQLALLDTRFVIVGDFNVPGDVAGLDRRTADVFTQYSPRQHVGCSTHASGNTLDLIITQEADSASQLISDLAVQSICFSDHHLVTCRLGAPPPKSPVTTTYSYRSLRRIDIAVYIDIAVFGQDILRSRLFGSLEADADEYAELFDAEVRRVLDIHAPLRTGRRRCGLSDEAWQAKRHRRRLGRRYRRNGLQPDKQAYRAACSAAREHHDVTSRSHQVETQRGGR